MKNCVFIMAILYTLVDFAQSASTNATKFNDLVFSAYYQTSFPDDLNDMSRRTYCNVENDDYTNNITDEFYIHDKTSRYAQEIVSKSNVISKAKTNQFYYDLGKFELSNYDMNTQSFLFQIPNDQVPQLINCSFGVGYFLKLNNIDKYYSIRVPKEKAKELLTDDSGKIQTATIYLKYFIQPIKKIREQKVMGQEVYELPADLKKIELYKDEYYKDKLGEVYIQ